MWHLFIPLTEVTCILLHADKYLEEKSVYLLTDSTWLNSEHMYISVNHVIMLHSTLSPSVIIDPNVLVMFFMLILNSTGHKVRCL